MLTAKLRKVTEKKTTVLKHINRKQEVEFDFSCLSSDVKIRLPVLLNLQRLREQD